MASLGENLKRIREAKQPRMSQTKLADLAGVSQQLVSQIERGVNTTTKDLPQLAKALGVPISDLDENFVPVSTSEEERILAGYRKATPKRQSLVRDILEEFAEDEAQR